MKSLRSGLIAVAAALLLGVPLSAFGQGAIQQAGSVTPGHSAIFFNNGMVQDGGYASGGGVGTTMSELGLAVRGSGSAPFANGGSGPNGENFCDYDAPTTNATGYHYLCLSPNAQGGGLISYGAGGIASTLPFQLRINGQNYTVPFSVGGITGPATSTVGDIVLFNNLTGNLVSDSHTLLTALAPLASPTFTGVVAMPDASQWTSSGLTLGHSATFTGFTIAGGTYSNVTLSGTTTLQGGGSIGSTGIISGAINAAFMNNNLRLTTVFSTSQGNGVGQITTGTGVGLQLGGQGSISDVRLVNTLGNPALEIKTGTVNVTLDGALLIAQQNNSSGAFGNGGGAVFGVTADGLVMSGQGATNDVAIYNSGGTQVLLNPTGTTNIIGQGSISAVAGAIKLTNSYATSPGNGIAELVNSSTQGAILGGQGSTSDVTLENKAGSPVAEIKTGSTSFTLDGALLIAQQNNSGGPSGNGSGLMFGATVNGLVANGQGSSFDISLGNSSAVAALQLVHGSTIWQFGSASFTVTGSSVVTLSNAPSGTSLVKEWFTIQDASGNTRYIPTF